MTGSLSSESSIPSGRSGREEQQIFLRLQAVGNGPCRVSARPGPPPCDCRARAGSDPWSGRRLAASWALRWNTTGFFAMRCGRSSTRKSGGCLAASVGVRCTSLFRGHDVPHRLPVPGLVDEDEGVDAAVLLVCKTVRSARSAEGRGKPSGGWRRIDPTWSAWAHRRDSR
jgi:hypothetical protein